MRIFYLRSSSTLRLSTASGHSGSHDGAGIMRLFAWLIAFTGTLVVETAALPQILGGLTPSLMLAVLLLGIAFQEFWPGFTFAAFAGLLLDITAGGGIHTLIALGAFFTMQAFGALAQWEEPLGRIGAVALGLILQPLLRTIGAEVADFVLGVTASGIHFSDVASAIAVRETVFALTWFALFAWLEIRAASRRRGRRLRHV